jgi:hypothetical protein
VLDGAYLVGTDPPVFRGIEPPRQTELQRLVERVAERIVRRVALRHRRNQSARADLEERALRERRDGVGQLRDEGRVAV